MFLITPIDEKTVQSLFIGRKHTDVSGPSFAALIGLPGKLILRSTRDSALQTLVFSFDQEDARERSLPRRSVLTTRYFS